MLTTEIIYPSFALRPFVHHYWVMKISDSDLSQMIMPVGCMKWMFHRKHLFDVNGQSDLSCKASVVGICEKAIRIHSSEEVELVAVFFLPYTAKMIMNIPCQEFLNSKIDIDDLGSPEFNDLKANVLEAETTDDCIRMIEEFILRRLIKAQDEPHFKLLSEVFRRMATNPGIRVNDLASAACLSERQFRRVFAENVGITPKQMQRIQRFHLATNELLGSGGTALDTLLYKYGYTDHSHFNHEFHEIANISPKEYLAMLKEIHKQNLMSVYRSYHSPK